MPKSPMGGGGGAGGGARRGRGRDQQRQDDGPSFDERVVDITRTSKVVKGGRHFGFRVLVVVGDNNGTVGIGMGKSREVPEAIRKATERARKDMKKILRSGTTIPHMMVSKFSASQVMLKPATPGTGVIAAGGVRAVMECAGIKDVLTKSLGSANKLNVVYATMQGLLDMTDAEQVGKRRNKPVAQLLPPWRRENAKPG
jgi:small subunit ribosomal protein S5